jgi:hypothetical protein
VVADVAEDYLVAAAEVEQLRLDLELVLVLVVGLNQFAVVAP